MSPRGRAPPFLAVCLLAAVAGAVMPHVEAVICESYSSPADCEGRWTDAGRCAWVDPGVCTAVEPLPEGRAAVTSVVEPEEAPIFAVTEEVAGEGPAPSPAAEAVGARSSSGARRMLLAPPPPPPPATAGPAAGAAGSAAQQACEDVPTPDEWTCEQQAGWGKCGESWMLEGGFCRRTCGLCSTGGTEGPQVVPAGAGQVAADEGPTTSAFCSQRPEVGPCRAAIPSWYYDPARKDCRPFVYGGCQGNGNRFPSYDACMQASRRFCGL